MTEAVGECWLRCTPFLKMYEYIKTCVTAKLDLRLSNISSSVELTETHECLNCKQLNEKISELQVELQVW